MDRAVGALLFLAAVPVFGQTCTYSVSAPGTNIGAGSGANTITVTTQNSCPWTYSTSAAWLSFTFGQGQRSGSGTLGWAAERNPTGSARSGIITVAGQTVTITQAGQNCSYTAVGDIAATVPATGGRGVFQIKTNCTWQASSSVPWITATGGGDVDGVINYTVAPNACVAGRSGTITAGTLSFAITQDGAAGNFSISPTSATIPVGGGTGSFTINPGAGCPWTASVSADWLTIVRTSGTGPGSLTYSVAANTGAARTGFVRVPPLAFAVNQEGVAPPPIKITAVVNAANYAPPPVAPGEIVVIYGVEIGPAALAKLELTPDGRSLTKTLAATRVLFDDVPAAMIYTSAGQVSAVVPYAVDGRISTSVVVEYNGVRSPAFPIPVAASSPAIFTLDQSGKNAGAILNQDFSINGRDNAAARGSVIQIFGTGAGTTLPASIDAQLTGQPLPLLSLPVSVTIGGADAKLWYAGGAPDAVAGLTQINAEVPLGIAPGDAVPVKIRIGDRDTQDGVTVSVK